ncbi:glycosyltransferase family 2 protein [Dokdonella sp.]|uniref:glycosyltransferase family 2 protein n=1 Tax=Dokdonella sp. TaxID=2291710 RepID=UPI00352783CD
MNEAQVEHRDGLVSVVMPAWNAAAFMSRSVDSVLAQSRADLELIIVDDCSTDDTAALIGRYAQADARVRPMHLASNSGVAAARNTGIAAARGEFVAFLDSDDWWHPRKLELQIGQMRRTGARVSYCAYQRIAEDGRVLSTVRPPARLTHADLLRSNYIGNLTGVYERRLGPAEFLKVGHEDYVFWLQMLKRAGSAECIEHDEPLAFYLVREGSVSANKLKAAFWQWRIYRDIESLPLGKAIWNMLHYLRNALAKRR